MQLTRYHLKTGGRVPIHSLIHNPLQNFKNKDRKQELSKKRLKESFLIEFHRGAEFSGLTYTVTKKKKVDEKWCNEDVDLLHDITGYAPKGCITAVMGPSGAGKSTFLDGLAGRIASGSLKGRVSLDGKM